MSFSHSPPGAVTQCSPALCEEIAAQIAELDKAADQALLADDVYADSRSTEPRNLPEGWRRIGDDPKAIQDALPSLSPAEAKRLSERMEPSDSQFRAMLYQHTDGSLAIAYKGTTMSSLSDWKNNAQQGFGFQSDYYERAMTISQDLDLAAELDGKPLSITGHSLGGGMAGAAAIKTGRPAMTFNPAGVHKKTVGVDDMSGVGGNVTDFVVEGDVLNHKVQDNRNVIRGGAAVGAGALGNGLLGPAGGGAAAGRTWRAMKDAIPQNVGTRISLPDTTTTPVRKWYDPRRISDAAYAATGVKQHLMPAVHDGLAAKRAQLVQAAKMAGCP